MAGVLATLLPGLLSKAADFGGKVLGNVVQGQSLGDSLKSALGMAPSLGNTGERSRRWRDEDETEQNEIDDLFRAKIDRLMESGSYKAVARLIRSHPNTEGLVVDHLGKYSVAEREKVNEAGAKIDGRPYRSAEQIRKDTAAATAEYDSEAAREENENKMFQRREEMAGANELREEREDMKPVKEQLSLSSLGRTAAGDFMKSFQQHMAGSGQRYESPPENYRGRRILKPDFGRIRPDFNDMSGSNQGPIRQRYPPPMGNLYQPKDSYPSTFRPQMGGARQIQEAVIEKRRDIRRKHKRGVKKIPSRYR